MTTYSKYFDKIRIRPAADSAGAEPEKRTCEWDGCAEGGEFRAPKGRGAEGHYHHYCLEHVREYNKSYNYFSGMSDEASWSHQKHASIGERPTWRMGVNAWSQNGRRRIFAGGRSFHGFDVKDEFDVLGGAHIEGQARRGPVRSRPVRALERRSLDTLNLDESATGEDIRQRYKDLVKRHHPDANGGDRSSEDRLREIIQAYKHLKSVDFC
jgi:hypothetical protein